MTGSSAFGRLAARVLPSVGGELSTNRRLRVALLIGGAILWVNLTVILADAIHHRSDQLGSLLDEHRRYETISKDDQWPQRQAAAEALAERAQQRLWAAESEAIARSEFQEWILRTARESGLERPQVRIEREVAGQAPAGSQAIAAQLSADFAPDAFVEFLKRIASNQRLTVVTSLRIQKTPIPRVDAILTGFTRSPAAASS